MDYQKLQAPSLKDLFISQIQNAIISGELKVGEKLPGERELADQMGISRAVVSAGMHELERRGFVKIRSKSGAVVADYIYEGDMETLNAVMQYQGDTFSPESIHSLLELRLAVELFVVNQLMDRATPEQLDIIGKKLGILCNAVSADQIADAALDFWHEMAYQSGDLIAPMGIHSFREPVKTLWRRFCKRYGAEPIIENTTAIYNAVCEGDRETAEHYVRLSMNEAISGDQEIYD